MLPAPQEPPSKEGRLGGLRSSQVAKPMGLATGPGAVCSPPEGSQCSTRIPGEGTAPRVPSLEALVLPKQRGHQSQRALVLWRVLL